MEFFHFFLALSGLGIIPHSEFTAEGIFYLVLWSGTTRQIFTYSTWARFRVQATGILQKEPPITLPFRTPSLLLWLLKRAPAFIIHFPFPPNFLFLYFCSANFLFFVPTASHFCPTERNIHIDCNSNVQVCVFCRKRLTAVHNVLCTVKSRRQELLLHLTILETSTIE